MTFGEKLQDLRRKGAMSQDILAEKLEVSRQAVSKWERDEAMPETEKIIRIANLFGVSIDYLLLDVKTSARQSAPDAHSSRQSKSGAFANRAERFIRRHGYKIGFYFAGLGVFIDLICLLLRGWWRSAVTGLTGGMTDFTNNNVFIPGFGAGDAMLDSFQQATQQMGNTASSFGDLLLLGLVPGTALIVFGIYVIIQGKKIAQNEQN